MDFSGKAADAFVPARVIGLRTIVRGLKLYTSPASQRAHANASRREPRGTPRPNRRNLVLALNHPLPSLFVCATSGQLFVKLAPNEIDPSALWEIKPCQFAILDIRIQWVTIAAARVRHE
jgi:hypothetical protein